MDASRRQGEPIEKCRKRWTRPALRVLRT